jgi:hypothetical protein
MKAKDIPDIVWIAAGGVAIVAALALWVRSRGGLANAAGAVVSGAASAADSVVGGAVVGAGQVVGIPATNADQCGRDLAAGNYWDASFSCPATRFISARFGGPESPVDQSIMDPRDAMAQRGTGGGTPTPVEPSRIDYSLGGAEQFYGWGAGA